MTDIVKAEWDAPWDVRLMEGELRVNALELGQRLEYNPANPRGFIALIERRIKSGKLNVSDFVHKRVDSVTGFGGTREISEYWLTLGAAHLVALQVRTNPADEIRKRVVKQLMGLKQPAAIASTDPAAFMTLVLTAVNKQTTLIEHWLSKPEPAERESELWISKDQRRHLQSQARALGKLMDKNLTQVWHAVCDDVGEVGKTGKAFAGVTRHRFDVVSEHLRQLYMAARINRDEADQDEPPPTMVRPEPQFIEAINGGGPVSRDWKQEGDVSMADVLSRVKAEGLVGEAALPKNLFPAYEYLERQRLIHPRIEMTTAHANLGPNARPLLFLSPVDVEVFLNFIRQEARRKSNGGAPRGQMAGSTAPNR